MSAASCGCSPNCRWPRSPGSKSLRDAEINEAKKVLATEATALCHGRAAAEAAAETARDGVRRRAAPATRCRRSRCRAMRWQRGVPAFELFVRAGLAASNGEARRLIKGGGARINDAVVDRRDAAGVARRSRRRRGRCKLSAGRKRHALVRAGVRPLVPHAGCCCGHADADERGEQLAQNARGQRAQRVDRHLRVVARAAQPEIGGEQALRPAAPAASRGPANCRAPN